MPRRRGGGSSTRAHARLAHVGCWAEGCAAGAPALAWGRAPHPSCSDAKAARVRVPPRVANRHASARKHARSILHAHHSRQRARERAHRGAALRVLRKGAPSDCDGQPLARVRSHGAQEAAAGEPRLPELGARVARTSAARPARECGHTSEFRAEASTRPKPTARCLLHRHKTAHSAVTHQRAFDAGLDRAASERSVFFAELVFTQRLPASHSRLPRARFPVRQRLCEDGSSQVARHGSSSCV